MRKGNTLNSLSETTSPTYSRIKVPLDIGSLVRTPQPLFSVINLSKPGAHSWRCIRWFLHKSLKL